MSVIMNRNTSPISPFKPEDYQLAYGLTEENQYPYQEIERFKANYAPLANWQESQIELANGSDEWIQKLMICFGKGGVLTLDPDFFMYQDYANQLGVDIHFVSSNTLFEFNLEEIVSEINRLKPAIFILSNPQNPTGVQFTEAFLQTLADAMTAINGYLVIDEAYIEFGEDYQRPEGDHVILLRTMSKLYGMAGLRIGIVQATGETFRLLTKINHPYPINNVVLNLANVFLEDATRLKAFTQYQLASRDALVNAFDQVKDLIAVKETATNFVFTYGPRAVELGQYLKANGFEARFYQEAGMEETVRYSIIQLEQYAELNQLILQWRKQHDS